MSKVTVIKLEDNKYEIVLKDGNIHDRVYLKKEELKELKDKIKEEL